MKAENSGFLDFQKIRQKISLADVLDMIGWTPVDGGRGFCPICKSDSPRSFSPNKERNIWRCFSCHRGGNQLDLAAVCLEPPRKLSVYQTAILLCRILNRSVPEPEEKP